jgi:hypothetical protein
VGNSFFLWVNHAFAYIHPAKLFFLLSPSGLIT